MFLHYNKICKSCGRKFIGVETQDYCTELKTSTCYVCGKKFKYTCSRLGVPMTCSSRCTNKMTVIDRQYPQNSNVKRLIDRIKDIFTR